jgi:hypothetical protein
MLNTFEQAAVDGPDGICVCGLIDALFGGKRLSTSLLGRARDLASAYWQLDIADESLQYSFLSVYDPSSGSAVSFNKCPAFGSRFAVNAFIRRARQIWCLMLDILGWQIDCEGPKSDEFSGSVSVLGVQLTGTFMEWDTQSPQHCKMDL